MTTSKIIKSIAIHSDYPVISGIKDLGGFLRFIEWIATPQYLREPKFQKDLAELIGVSEDTLTDWKRHPQFPLLLQSKISAWIKERVPDVIGALYETASAKGESKEVELFLRLAGMQTRKEKEKKSKK